MRTLVAGVGAMVDVAYGNVHAGVVFHTSWTVGLLLAVMPQMTSRPPSFAVLAYRKSTLSHVQVCPNGSGKPPGGGALWVTCAKAPMCLVMAPP